MLGLVLALAILAWQGAHTQPEAWRVLPENSGAITAVAFQFTYASSSTSCEAIQAFLKAINTSATIYVICGNTEDAALFDSTAKSWRLANPSRIRTVVVGSSITGWCKDRFLVAGGSPARLLCPMPSLYETESRAGDSNVAPALARDDSAQFQVVDLPLRFDSGDIVTTQSRVIVSDNLFEKNNRDTHFQARLEAMFGKKVVWLHGVPPHHIGMFAAPLDDRTVLVGDPALMKPMWSTTLDNTLGRAYFSPEVEALFANAQAQLRAAGFRVVKIPTAYLAPQVYITYTNGVFEVRGGKKIVYMPSYGEPALDSSAAATYAAEGWTVKPIPVRKLYNLRGTIGCLINVVGRG